MVEPVIIGDATLYLGDCLEIMPTLGAVDAVVTSPPYGQQRDYGEKIDDWRGLVCGAMRMSDVGAQVLVNLGPFNRNGRVVRYWDDLIVDMESDGWALCGWYVWDKGSGLPGDWGGCLAPSHEWVLHFRQTKRVANKWVKTKHRSTGGKSMRNIDGSMDKWTHKGAQVQDKKVSDSVIRITRNMARGGADMAHPATFPVALPTNLILSFSDQGNVILDPFMGSGTTGVACANLGRKFIGIELEPKYFDIACERIDAAQAQCDMFVDAAHAPEQATIL